LDDQEEDINDNAHKQKLPEDDRKVQVTRHGSLSWLILNVRF